MTETITNITELYLPDVFTLCYTPNGKPTKNINNVYMEQMIEYNFELATLPEYKEIGYDVYNYVVKNKLINKTPTTFYVVSNDKKLTKNHTNSNIKYIDLFSIVFEKKKRIEILNIEINVELLVPKITLSNGTKPYTKEIYADENPDIINNDTCTICLLNTGELITTDCNHKYHLVCLKSVPKLLCPNCRNDISLCLIQNGVSPDEIKMRLEDQIKEAEPEEFHNCFNCTDFPDLPLPQFIKLCMETLRLNNGDIIAYFDIIFDMNQNASHLFAEISYLKSKKEKGIFAYVYESPLDFITHVMEPTNKSIVTWAKASMFKNTQFKDIVKNRLDRIKNPKDEYIVLIIIDNMYNAHILNKNTHQEYDRISQSELMCSLSKCVKCRSHNNPNTPNREYKWAKNILHKIKKIEI